MAYVYPFIGTRYNPKIISDLSKVLTPPYDCITEAMQDEFYKRHPKNFVRIILGKEVAGDDEFNNRYSRAANLLQEWRREQSLVDDPKQSFYLMEQDYANPAGKRLRRRGFYGLVRLQGYGAGKIRAHEKTFKAPKADRYRLMRATQFNLSPVFVLYEDPKDEVAALLSSVIDKTKPVVASQDDEGTKHSLWLSCSKELLKSVSDAMRDRELLIADGHHRFETALHYRNEMRRLSGQQGVRHGSDYLMMYLVSMSDPGLEILPTHRALAEEAGVGVEVEEVVEDLKEHFKVEPVSINARKEPEKGAKLLMDKIAEAGKKAIAMAMVLRGGRAFVLTLKRGVSPEKLTEDQQIPPVVANLDVSVLHHFIIPHVWIGNPEIELDEGEILYTRDAVEAIKLSTTRKACVVFLMNSPKMEQVVKVSRAGLRLPHKTTYFYPKVISGMVVRDMKTFGG